MLLLMKRCENENLCGSYGGGGKEKKDKPKVVHEVL